MYGLPTGMQWMHTNAVIFQSGLVSKYIEVLPECQRRWPRTFGGDEGVNNCAALAQGIDNREQAYINEPSLHRKSPLAYSGNSRLTMSA